MYFLVFGRWIQIHVVLWSTYYTSKIPHMKTYFASCILQYSKDEYKFISFCELWVTFFEISQLKARFVSWIRKINIKSCRFVNCRLYFWNSTVESSFCILYSAVFGRWIQNYVALWITSYTSKIPQLKAHFLPFVFMLSEGEYKHPFFFRKYHYTFEITHAKEKCFVPSTFLRWIQTLWKLCDKFFVK